jgi:uncharacterized membrane protein
MEKIELNEKRIHEAFEIGIVIKGIGACAETILGILLLFTNVTNLVQTLIQNELIEDPDNFFATHAQAFTHVTPQAQLYGALYLLSHGIIKLLLVAGLLRKKMWAYPASLAVLSLFIFYQVIRYFHTHSIGLLVLTVFDLAVVWLVWREYRRVSKNTPKNDVPQRDML